MRSLAVKCLGVLMAGLGLTWGASTASGCLQVATCGAPCETQGGGGGTGGGTTSTGATTSTSDIRCTKATEAKDCPADPADPCREHLCIDGFCEKRANDELVPQGSTECLVKSCSEGEVVTTFTPEKTGCGANAMKTYCNGEGKCIGCEVKDDCLSETVKETDCQKWACVEEVCTPMNTRAGDLPDDEVGDCQKRRCDGNGLLIPELDDMDKPAEEEPPNPCTEWECVGIRMPNQVFQEGLECGDDLGLPTCTEGFADPQDKCDSRGACQSGTPISCGSFLCGATECKKSCTLATEAMDCALGNYCEGMSCSPKKNAGSECTVANECNNPLPCVDGFCCETNCTSQCRSCALSGNLGKCATLARGVSDTCAAGFACNNGNCVTLISGGNLKKAVGQSCAMESDCFNESNNSTDCYDDLCRLPIDAPCEETNAWHCSTKCCSSSTGCAQCANDADCGAGGACAMANGVLRCRLGPGAHCGADNDCVMGLTCNLASGSPGTCQ